MILCRVWSANDWDGMIIRSKKQRYNLLTTGMYPLDGGGWMVMNYSRCYYETYSGIYTLIRDSTSSW